MYAQTQKRIRILPFRETTSVCDVTLRPDEHSVYGTHPSVWLEHTQHK